MFTTSAKLPRQVIGGFVQKNDKVWKGAVRDTRGRILWVCDHVHSRPEYNARYRFDVEHNSPDPRIWEYSADNCGKTAQRQWNGQDHPDGDWGLIALNIDEDLHLPRDDVKHAVVGTVRYRGQIRLTEDGNRLLWVKHEESGKEGAIDLDALKSTAGWPRLPSHLLKRWLTAAGLLVNSAWGLTFHLPWKGVHADKVDFDLIDRLVPADHDLRSQGAHIRRAKKGFEVVDKDGKVVVEVPHRGRAMRELEKLLGSASPTG